MTLAVKNQLAQLFASLARTKSKRDVKYFLELISSTTEGESLSQTICSEGAAILGDEGNKEAVIWLADFMINELEDAIDESGDPKAKECKPDIETLRSMLKEKEENQSKGATKASA